MVLDHATPDRLDFSRRIPVRSPVLVGVVFIAVAFVPLVAPGAVDALRVLASLVLGGAGVALVRVTRARVERSHLDLAHHQLVGPRGESSIEGARAIALLGSGVAQLHPAALYRAELCLPGERRELLLENADPGRLLWDLSLVLEHLDLPIETGWGLPAGATPWRSPAPSDPHRSPSRRQLQMRALTSPFQRLAGSTTIVGGLATAVAMGIMMTARFERGEAIAALSVVLAVATVAVSQVVGLIVLTDRTTISGNGSLRVQRRALGIRLCSLEIPFDRIRHAWAVGPDPVLQRHVLLELDDGPVAFACAGDDAVRAAERIAP